MKTSIIIPVIAAVCFTPCTALAGQAVPGRVVINEIFYDDAGTDDREFVELYNAGGTAVDIGGWVLNAYDQGATANPTTTIPAGTMLAPGGFYVIGNAGVLNLNHSVAMNFLENDQEVSVLRDSVGVLMDAVAYETNKGVGFVTASPGAPADAAAVAAQVGPGIFSNHAGLDVAGSPLNSNVSWGRFVNGRDTNNNGRDFGLRPSTPGTTNAPGGTMTFFTPPNPVAEPPGTVLSSMVGTFVPVRVIDPALVDGVNPNALSPPHGTGTKAYVAWDTSGGGNCVTTNAVFPDKTAGFAIRAYLDTTDLPVQVSATSVQFRGSEVTIYGLGGGEASTGLTDLTDLNGSIGLSPVALPASESINGTTGIAWVYERVGLPPAAGGSVSEKLYLVDANDGGDSHFGGNTPLDWVILAVHDLSGTNAGWYDLSIFTDSAGNGIATFNGMSTLFTAPDMNSSTFNIFYRENLQLGADGTPDALLRPPTFTTTLLGGLSFAARAAGATNLLIPAASGQTIGIEYSDTLTAGSWLDIGNVLVSGASGTFSDTDAVRLARSRGFYRAFLR